MDLDKVIRKVPDFPKKGILFYDVTSVFMNPEAFDYVLNEMESCYSEQALDGIIAVESRGFLLAAPFARERHLPLVLARKKGKLPGDTVSCSYDLEYGQAVLELHKADLSHGKKWLIVDDLIATGGTLQAVAKMIEGQSSKVAGIFAMIGLPFLGYKKKLSSYDIHTLIEFNSEQA